MNQIPNTTQAGQILTSTGQQSQGRWTTQVNGVYISQTFAVYGAVPNDTFPGFFMPVPSGATVTLMEVQTVLTSGTVTVEVLQNGTGVGGLTALGVTSSASGWVDPSGTGAVSDGDFFTIKTTSGSMPVSLTVSIVFMVSGIYTA